MAVRPQGTPVLRGSNPKPSSSVSCRRKAAVQMQTGHPFTRLRFVLACPITALAHVGGNVTVRAENGPINLEGDGRNVSLETQNGPIGVRLVGIEWEAGGLVAKAQNGPLSVELPAQSIGCGHRVCRSHAVVLPPRLRTSGPRVRRTTSTSGRGAHARETVHRQRAGERAVTRLATGRRSRS